MGIFSNPKVAAAFQWFSVLCVIALFIPCSYAVVDIRSPEHDVIQALGLDHEVVFVTNGELREKAVAYNWTIPVFMDHLTFVWHNTGSFDIEYRVGLKEDHNLGFLMEPFFNIPPAGDIPRDQPRDLKVYLRCRPDFTGTVPLTIQVNYTYPSRSRPTFLVLRRRKLCDKDSVTAKAPPISEGMEVNARPAMMPTPMNVLYVAVGCVCAFVTLISVMLLCYFFRTRSARAAQPPVHDTECIFSNGGKNCEPISRGQHLEPFLRSISPSCSRYSSERRSCIGSSVYTPVPSVVPAMPRKIDTAGIATRLAVPSERVVLGSLLHAGTFGELRTGLLTDETGQPNESSLAILTKKLNSIATDGQTEVFLRDGFWLYGIPEHPQVLQVLFMTRIDVAPVLCYPRPMYGNLKRFLLASRGAQNTHIECVPVSTQNVVEMAVGVVAGMLHLHQHGIVHQDVAARNCVVDAGLRVQVTDSALSRDLFPTDYACLGDNENRPVKWLAPEVILPARRFSTASDVWSFGVLTWELMTLGQEPYADVDPWAMSERLSEGLRLTQPYNCPDELFGLMFCCWAASPESRPTFAQLFTALSDFAVALAHYV